MPSLTEHKRQITQPAVHSLTAICTRGFQQLFGTIVSVASAADVKLLDARPNTLEGKPSGAFVLRVFCWADASREALVR